MPLDIVPMPLDMPMPMLLPIFIEGEVVSFPSRFEQQRIKLRRNLNQFFDLLFIR